MRVRDQWRSALKYANAEKSVSGELYADHYSRRRTGRTWGDVWVWVWVLHLAGLYGTGRVR